MIRYSKGPEPKALVEWRATPGVTWESVTSRALHDELLRDQGDLCAYCQRRIRSGPSMHVEHWRARSTHDADQLRWKNLLGVCSGASGGERHCDASRGNAALFLHPVDGEGPSPIDALRYRDDGSVVPEHDAPAQSSIATDLSLLRLDCESLRRSRKAVLDALRERLKRKGFTPREVRALYGGHSQSAQRDRPEHAEVVRHVLARWARKRDIALP